MTATHVLDIDLDLFLSDIVDNKPCRSRRRAAKRDYKPWPADAVIQFLEENCGLCKDSPVPGRVVVHHDEVFDFWHELIIKEELTAPFHVVHADAHSDMGMDSSIHYMLQEYLHLPIDERHQIEHGYGRLDCGNFMVVAAACRWINKISFVLHENWFLCGGDFPNCYFRDEDTGKRIVHLRPQRKGCTPGCADEYLDTDEPEIPIELFKPGEYKANYHFSFVTLAQSPSFTPATADALVPLIAQYIRSQ